MDAIECGGARIALQIGNDGIGAAHFSGLLMPGNIQAVSAYTLAMGMGRGAKGLLYRNDRAAVCCDPQSMAASYPTLTPRLRAMRHRRRQPDRASGGRQAEITVVSVELSIRAGHAGLRICSCPPPGLDPYPGAGAFLAVQGWRTWNQCGF